MEGCDLVIVVCTSGVFISTVRAAVVWFTLAVATAARSPELGQQREAGIELRVCCFNRCVHASTSVLFNQHIVVVVLYKPIITSSMSFFGGRPEALPEGDNGFLIFV